MNAEKVQRNIGIIGDGPTDRIIFGKIVRCILTEDTDKDFIDCKIVELPSKNIRDAVDKYFREENKNLNSDMSISIRNYQDLVKQVAGVLYGGFIEFSQEVYSTCNCDILILTTDSEKALSRPDDYFNYGIKLFHILSEAIIKFYESILNAGYSQEQIPLVIPIATFPSIEIIIAAAKGLETPKYYNKKAGELKDLLYKKSERRKLMPDELEDKALKFITIEGLKMVFNNIPESRDFIQTLSCYKVSCFL